MPPRARFTSTDARQCTLTYTEAPTGAVITRDFFVPRDGSTVMERWAGGTAIPVCEWLGHYGRVLSLPDGVPLITVIRAAYRERLRMAR
jgi:hypothetical protein